jgi:hypothetical protein
MRAGELPADTIQRMRGSDMSKNITLNIGLNNNARVSRLHSNATAAKTVADIAARIFESVTIGDYRFGYLVSTYEGESEPTAVIEFETDCNDVELVQRLTQIACSVFSQECVATLIETKTDRSRITRGLLEFNANIEPCYEFDIQYFRLVTDCDVVHYVERPTL